MTLPKAEKRSVSTDALETLGKIITSNEKRDAIHIAVEPTKARMPLKPGQHVGVDGTTDNPVGIVDPFLNTSVRTGEWFWLLIYPRQIKSLRHVWSHPAFEDEPRSEEERLKIEQVIDAIDGQHRKAIQEFANSIGVKYDDLMKHANDYVTSGDYWSEGDRFEGIDFDYEFWEHYEKVTGTAVDQDKKHSFFSCAC